MNKKQAKRLLYLSVEIENAVSRFKTKERLYDMILETRRLLKNE